MTTGALAVLAHSSADGHLPDAGLVFSLVALLTWAVGGLARRELTPARLLALVGGGQLAMHLVLELASSRHDHVSAGYVSAERMTAAHVVATAVVVGALAVAERTVLGLARTLASLLPRKLTPFVATAPLSVPVYRHVPAAPVVLDVLSWRGPPAEQA
ncbi:hypothetical protein ACVDFE_32320 [Lentzea chajnantorensis]